MRSCRSSQGILLVIGLGLGLSACGRASRSSVAAEGDLDFKCSILMPLLQGLPNPGLPIFAASGAQFAASLTASFIQRGCVQNIKATLSQQSLDDIAAVVGSQLEVALDQETANQLSGLTRSLSQYVPQSTQARADTATMKDIASSLVYSFAKKDPPLTYLYNYVSAATIELKVLQEELRFNLIDAVSERGDASTVAAKARVVAANAAKINDSIASYIETGRVLREEMLPAIVVGFFQPARGGIEESATVISGFAPRQVFYHYTRCYEAKPLSAWELSMLDAAKRSGSSAPDVLQMRVNALAAPICYHVDDCQKAHCSEHLNEYEAALKSQFTAAVAQIQSAADKALFQTAEMDQFVKQVRVVQANAQNIAGFVKDGTLFKHMDTAKNEVAGATSP